MAISTYARKLLLQQLKNRFRPPVKMSLAPWLNGVPALESAAWRIIWQAPDEAILGQFVELLDADGQLAKANSDFFVAFAQRPGVDIAALRELQIALDPSTSPLTLLGSDTITALRTTLVRYELDRGLHHTDQKNAAQRAVTERMIRAEAPRRAHNYLEALNWVPERTGDDQELTKDYVEIAKGHMRDWLQLVRGLAIKENVSTVPFDNALETLGIISRTDRVSATGQIPSGSGLERRPSKYPAIRALYPWAQFLSAVRLRICSMRLSRRTNFGDYQEISMSTGFLISPDLVLTTYHAIQYAHENPGTTRIELWFDYLQEGQCTTVDLATDWLVAHSSSAPNDPRIGCDEDVAGWPPDRLDFAVLRTNKLLNRGHLVPAASYTPRAEEGLIVFQHPDGGPLGFATHPAGLIKPLPGGTRWAHRVDTLPGSGGGTDLHVGRPTHRAAQLSAPRPKPPIQARNSFREDPRRPPKRPRHGPYRRHLVLTAPTTTPPARRAPAGPPSRRSTRRSRAPARRSRASR